MVRRQLCTEIQEMVTLNSKQRVLHTNGDIL